MTYSPFSIPEEEIVILFSRLDPSGDVLDRVRTLLNEGVRPVDFERVIQIANHNQVTPVMYMNFMKLDNIPQDFMKRLQQLYIVTLQRNTRHFEETGRILSSLEQNGVKVIPLKGSFIAETLLADVGLYPTSDIDIMVRPEDIRKAVIILENIGYRETDKSRQEEMVRHWYNLGLTGPEFTIELHWNILVRYFPVDPAFWWEDATETNVKGLNIFQLSKEKLLISLILNIFKHGFKPMKIFLPAQALMARETIDLKKVIEMADLIRAKKLMIFTLKLMHDMFDHPINKDIPDKKIIGYGLFRMKVYKGFFKKTDRYFLGMLVFVFLLNTPVDMLKHMAKRLFPHPGEIRLRYGLPVKSKLVYLYYFLNPILLLTRRKR